MWESHAASDIQRVSKSAPDPVVSDPDRGVDDQRVAAVTTPQSMPDQVEFFFWLLTSAPAPTPKPEIPAVDRDPYDGIGMR